MIPRAILKGKLLISLIIMINVSSSLFTHSAKSEEHIAVFNAFLSHMAKFHLMDHESK